MKKEKQIKSYQRKTKSGKMVTVKAHTAKYDAAEKAREAARKKGAGKELEERKKKPVPLEIPFDKEEENKVLDDVKETDKKESTKNPAEKKTTKKVRPVGSGTKEPTPKRKSEAKVAKTTASKPATSELAFTAAEFKEWYRGTGSATDKKVAKALRAQLGRSGYRKLEDEAIDNYSSRGHLSLFKGLSSAPATKTSSQKKEAKVKEAKETTKATKSTTNKTSISPGGKPVPAREEGILTRAAKLPKGVSLKGGWHRVDASGTKGVGYSSWGSKADVYEAVLSNGKKAILKRTYGPAGEDKTTFE